MSASEIQAAFPALTPFNFRISSDADDSYNCIAWAAGDGVRWWEPSGKRRHHWPLPTPAYSIANYVKAYESKGFEICPSADAEPGYVKIAIYADAQGEVKHAARLMPDGWW